MKFLVLDTEDNSQGIIYHLIFFDGDTFFSFGSDREKAIDFLRSQKRFIKCFSVNLQYDLINLFGVERLIKETELIFSKTSLLAAKFNKITFIDTLNHWKISVSKMGEILGERKDPFDPTNEIYCKKDCYITWNYVDKMIKKYNTAGIDFKLTVGSTALNYFKKEYDRIRNLKLSDERLEEFKQYYYGGRTECFRIGNIKTEKKDINCIDINSLYPFCMTKIFPNPYIFFEVKDIPETGFYLIHCKVESNLEIPILPKRINKRLCFPNGVFTGHFSSIEFKYFLEQGGKLLETYKIIHFPITFKPFEMYVNTLYNKRKMSEDIYESEVFKLMLNSLYGKFGQGNEKPCIISISEYLNDIKKYKGGFPILDNQYVITTEIGSYPNHTNFIYSLFTTAYGRVELHKLLMKVQNEGNTLLYADTDSVIYIGAFIKGNTTLGGFKNEYSTNNIFIKNVKEYYFLTETGFIYKIKGLMKIDEESIKQYFDGKEIIYNSPLKIRESLHIKNKEQKANYWIDKLRQSKGIYEKGNIINGKVFPYILKEQIKLFS